MRQVISFLDQEQPTEAVAVEQIPALKPHGGDRRSKQAKQDQDDNVILKQQGNSAAYLKARLQRDHTEIAEALDRNEFKSARAAAIEAGIIKPVPTVRLVDDLNKVAASITKHLTNDQLIVVAANNALIPVFVSVRCAAKPTCLPDSIR